MKHLSITKTVLLLLTLVPFRSFSQTKEKHFFSSFVINNQSFNYEYKLTSNQISSLKIEKITSSITTDTAKIKDNLMAVNKRIEENATNWQIPTDSLPVIKSELTEIMKNIPAGIRTIETSNSQLDGVCARLKSTIDSLKSDTLNTQKIIEIESLITNLGQIKNANIELFSTDNEAKFAAFTTETIKSILDEKLRNKFSIQLDEKQLNDLSQQIFYEILARRSFDNDQPSTAFLRLRSTKLNGFFENVKTKKIAKQQPPSDLIIKQFMDSLRVIAPYLNDNFKLKGFFDQQQFISTGKKSSSGKKGDVLPTVPLQMKFKEAELEFEAGTIKNVQALFNLMVNGHEQPVKFRNNMPISITNKFTPEQLWNHKIYASNPEMLPQNLIITQNLPKGLQLDTTDNSNYDLFFRLGDLIRYDIILANYREDYSPKDDVAKLSDQQNVIELKKQERSKILTLKTYTDFNGINSEQPNGLIQVEASIGVNLMTQRHQSVMGIRSKRAYAYEGIFTKADLTGHLSKIEDNNKYLPLAEKDTVALLLSNGQKQFKVTPLDLYRYKNTGIDFNLNIYKANFVRIMSNFQINGTFGIWRTGVADSLSVKNNSYEKGATRNEVMVTSTAGSICFAYEFMPEERYSFKVSASNTWLTVRNPQMIFNPDLKHQIRTLSFEGYLNLNSENTSRLFFRWKLNTQASDSKINFNQVQIGYLVDVFKTSK